MFEYNSSIGRTMCILDYTETKSSSIPEHAKKALEAFKVHNSSTDEKLICKLSGASVYEISRCPRCGTLARKSSDSICPVCESQQVNGMSSNTLLGVLDDMRAKSSYAQAA